MGSGRDRVAVPKIAAGIFWGGAFADAATTWHALEHHDAIEQNPLVDGLTPGQTALAITAFKAGIWWVLRRMERSHPKLARRLMLAGGSLWLGVAVHNTVEVH